MFEAIYGAILLAIILYLFIRRSDWSSMDQWNKNVSISGRIDELEKQTRYVADQPTNYYTVGSAFLYSTEEWEEQKRKNDVPINDVVKAIVKHLGMEIEKVHASTIKNPQEVKVVEKPVIGQTIIGPTGIVTMPDGSGIPMPKPKRKYTKRTPNGQKAKTKKGN